MTDLLIAHSGSRNASPSTSVFLFHPNFARSRRGRQKSQRGGGFGPGIFSEIFWSVTLVSLSVISGIASLGGVVAVLAVPWGILARKTGRSKIRASERGLKRSTISSGSGDEKNLKG
jgi:hypothetical protein